MIISFGYAFIELQMDINNPLIFPSTIKANNHHIDIGGRAANQAISAARSGAKTCLISTIGNDIFGKKILDTLRREGIQTSGIAKKDTPTSIINSIITNKNQKASIILNGASTELLATQLPDNMFNEKNLILLQNDVDIDININILKRAKSKNTRSIICIEHNDNTDISIFNYADIVIVNKTISVIPNNKNTQIIKIEYNNDAFDIFCGCFAACTQAGMDFKNAIKYGNSASSLIDKKQMTHKNIPYLCDIEENIKNLEC